MNPAFSLALNPASLLLVATATSPLQDCPKVTLLIYFIRPDLTIDEPNEVLFIDRYSFIANGNRYLGSVVMAQTKTV